MKKHISADELENVQMNTALISAIGEVLGNQSTNPLQPPGTGPHDKLLNITLRAAMRVDAILADEGGKDGLEED